MRRRLYFIGHNRTQAMLTGPVTTEYWRAARIAENQAANKVFEVSFPIPETPLEETRLGFYVEELR